MQKCSKIMVQLTYCIFTCSAKRFHCSHVPSTTGIDNDKKKKSQIKKLQKIKEHNKTKKFI